MDKIKILTAAQKGELNAVVLYKALANVVKDDKDKELMLSIAADEGRHAAQLKNLTNKTLKPTDTLKNLTLFSYKLFGRKTTFFIMAKSEAAASKAYVSLLDAYPQLKQISDDEAKHGESLLNSLK